MTCCMKYIVSTVNFHGVSSLLKPAHHTMFHQNFLSGAPPGFASITHVMLTMTGLYRGCSALFSAVTGIQKLDLSDTVVRDDGMQAVAQLSNLNNLNLAYSGIFAAI